MRVLARVVGLQSDDRVNHQEIKVAWPSPIQNCISRPTCPSDIVHISAWPGTPVGLRDLACPQSGPVFCSCQNRIPVQQAASTVPAVLSKGASHRLKSSTEQIVEVKSLCRKLLQNGNSRSKVLSLPIIFTLQYQFQDILLSELLGQQEVANQKATHKAAHYS